MAFRMNRPVIKGTANHKASIAKAKATSVVSQSRTKGDAGLIGAANTLGESYKPQAIDFELDKINIDVPEKKEKKPLTPEEQAAKDARKQARKDKRANKKRKKNLQKEYESEHLEGTLFPDGKYYDAKGNEINNKTKKVKKEKEPKVKKEKRKLELGKKVGKFFRNTAGQIVETADSLISGTVNAAGQIINEAGVVVGDVLKSVDAGLGKVTSDISKGIEGLEQTIETEKNRITEARDKRLEELRQQKLSKEAEEKLAAKISAQYMKDIAIMNAEVKNRKGGISVDEKLRSD